MLGCVIPNTVCLICMLQEAVANVQSLPVARPIWSMRCVCAWLTLLSSVGLQRGILQLVRRQSHHILCLSNKADAFLLHHAIFVPCPPALLHDKSSPGQLPSLQ